MEREVSLTSPKSHALRLKTNMIQRITFGISFALDIYHM